MARRLFVTAALLVIAGFETASAQTLSANCTSALTAIAANPDASSCLSPGSLISLFVGNGSASIIDPVNSWLNNICGAVPCSNATLSSVVANVTSGCSSELSALGVSTSTDTLTSTVQSVYPTVRNVVCLKDSSTNCVTQTLTNLQNILGTLTVSNVVSHVEKEAQTSFPTNVTCTDCVQAAYNVINQQFPSVASQELSTLESQCGSSFVDGSTPSGIIEGAITASAAAKPGSGALGTTSLITSGALAGIGISTLIVVSSFFSLLS